MENKEGSIETLGTLWLVIQSSNDQLNLRAIYYLHSVNLNQRWSFKTNILIQINLDSMKNVEKNIKVAATDMS